MSIKLKYNQRFMAFENYDGGAVSLFNKLKEAQNWARHKKMENKNTFSKSEKRSLTSSCENAIYIDVVNINKKGFYDLVETVWDCPLF